MRKLLIAVGLVMGLSSAVAQAQVVGQGAAGTDPWKVAQTGELPAGTQNIGDVDVLTLPSVTIGVFPDNEPLNVNQWGGSATTLGQKAMAASVPVVIASDQSAIPVSHAILGATTGSITAASSDCGVGGSCVTASGLGNMGAVLMTMSGTYTMPSVVAEVTADGSTWWGIAGYDFRLMELNAQLSLSANESIAYSINLPAGVTQFRVRCATFTSGTLNILISPGAEPWIPIKNSIFIGNEPLGVLPVSSLTDGATFNQEVDAASATGFILDDTAGVALSENDIAAARITPARAQVMRVEGATRGTYATLTGTSVDVNCTGGCASPPTSNIVTLSFSESVAAPTAATWYKKRQLDVPAAATYVPSRALSSVTTAGSQTSIAVHLKMGEFNVSTNAFTDANSVAAPRHYGRLWACVTTALSAVATNVTVTYTNEEGTTGRTTVALTIPASAPVGNCFEFQLQATTGQMRDEGVRDVTAVSDTAAPTGVIEICGSNTLLEAQGAANALEQTTYDTAVAANPEHLVILLKQVAVTAQQRTATLVGSIR